MNPQPQHGRLSILVFMMTPQETLENLKRIILIQTLHKLQINKQKVKKVIRFSSITLPYETSTK
jgi:hypothetical protein